MTSQHPLLKKESRRWECHLSDPLVGFKELKPQKDLAIVLMESHMIDKETHLLVRIEFHEELQTRETCERILRNQFKPKVCFHLMAL